VLALRPVTGSIQRVTPALGVLAFAFGYGAVLSVIEDQSASLFLGAAVGVLWRETRTSPIPTAEASCRTVRT
jgi:ligand-binding sensor domain-containing protein